MNTLGVWTAGLFSALLVAAVAAPAEGGVVGAGGARQTATLTYSSTKPSSPSGIHFVADWVNPNDHEARPIPVKRIVIRGPKGAVIDTAALPSCEASDTELLAEGAGACPANTRVGGGKVITDAGPSAPFPRYSSNTSSIFNNRNEQINFAETDNPPPFRAVSRSTIRGSRTVAPVPPFPPGVPASQSLTSLKHLDLTFPRLVHNGMAYFRTPASCPRAHEWTDSITFVYADDVAQRVVTKTPCRGAEAAVPAR